MEGVLLISQLVRLAQDLRWAQSSWAPILHLPGTIPTCGTSWLRSQCRAPSRLESLSLQRSSPKLYAPPKDPEDDGSEPPLVLAVDCGMKRLDLSTHGHGVATRFNIVRYFVYYLRVRLKVVPWNYDFSKEAAGLRSSRAL